MKGKAANCLRCGNAFTKRKKDHKFCKSGCRTVYNRKKSGQPEPEFLRGVNKPLRSKPTELIPTNQIQIRSSNDEELLIRQQINYYERVLQDAEQNVFPLWTIGGAAAGAVLGSDNIERGVYALIGGFFGKQMDAKRKKDIIKIANENIKYLRSQIKGINQAKQFAKLAIQTGKIEVKRKGIMQVIDTDTYKSKNIPSLGLNRNSQWHYLFGDPSQNFIAMLHGLPGNGKSTFSVQLADYFQRHHGDVLYIASEQKGLNKSFQDLLNQYANSTFQIANNPKDHNYDKIAKAAKDFKLVIIDSINHIGLSVEEFEKIRDKAPNTAFVAIMQSTKDGDFKGTQEWAHNCDIIIEMKRMTAYQTKSRFAPPANIKVIR